MPSGLRPLPAYMAEILSDPIPPPPPQNNRRLALARLAAIVFVVALSVFIYAIRDRVAELHHYGYFGVFVLSILSSATVILPAPGLAFVFAAGSLGLSPLGIGLAAGLGATLGEFSGYLAGFSGQGVVEHQRIHHQLEFWMQHYGPLTIAVLGFLPLPIFDLAGFAAGALKMHPLTFVLACAAGKIPKMLIVAYMGAYSIHWYAPCLSHCP